MFGFFKHRRRRKLLAAPFPEAWQAIIDRNVAVFPRLSVDEQQRLIAATRIIASERSFVGLGGLAITDEIKLTVAAQAALLLVGEAGYYFDRVPTIFVHPDWPTTKMKRPLQEGQFFSDPVVIVEEDVVIEGQMLAQDEIRLVWDEVLDGGRDPADGENVVLHEFAHHLDGLDGASDGLPPLPSATDERRWKQVLSAELSQLRRDLAARRRVFLHAEAAENWAELFAYSTECFFEQPHELNEWHPDLFAILLAFYKTDPRRWFNSGEPE